MEELIEYYNNLIQDKESEILDKKWLDTIVNLFKEALEEYGEISYIILREPRREPKEESRPDNFFLLTLWLIKLPFNKLLYYITTEQPKEFLVISLNNKYNVQFDVESLLCKQPIEQVYRKFIEPQSQKLIRAYKENEQ